MATRTKYVRTLSEIQSAGSALVLALTHRYTGIQRRDDKVAVALLTQLRHIINFAL